MADPRLDAVTAVVREWRGAAGPDSKHALLVKLETVLQLRPLRTRAEVDAEIVACIRDDWFENSGNYPVGLADSTRANLLQLCREPTRPDPTELGACPPECVPCQRHECSCGASFPTPMELAVHQDEACPGAPAAGERPCNCPQALALKAQLDRCRAIVRALAKGEINGASACMALRVELAR